MILILSCLIDLAFIVVFTPTAVLLWRLHDRRADRWQLTAAAVFIDLVAGVAIVVRLTTGSVPVWFLLAYLMQIAAVLFVIVGNAEAIRRNRTELARIRDRR